LPDDPAEAGLLQRLAEPAPDEVADGVPDDRGHDDHDLRGPGQRVDRGGRPEDQRGGSDGRQPGHDREPGQRAIRPCRLLRAVEAALDGLEVGQGQLDLDNAELLEWVVEDTDLPRPQAALLLGMVAHAGICQISNTEYTASCSMPRSVLAPYLR